MRKVSIIIPVYNVEKYLKQCLDSVINQTLKDIEIICVNDCSPDNSLSILKEYANKDTRIKIIDLKENIGPGTARNNALDIANSEYIMFLDPDDWYEPDTCELAYNQISKNKNDFVIFGYNKYFEDSDLFIEQYHRMEPFLAVKNNPKIYIKNLNKNWIKNAFCVCQIYNKNFLDSNNIRYADLRLCEDGLFFTKAVVYADNISVIMKPLYNYRIRNNKENQSSKKHLWKELLYAKKIAFEFAQKNCNTEELLPHLNFYITSLMFWFNKFDGLSYVESKTFYNQLKQIFTELEKTYKVSEISDIDIRIDKYMNFIKDSYGIYLIKSIPKNIFSIRSRPLGKNKKQKYITIFGIKINLKRNKNE